MEKLLKAKDDKRNIRKLIKEYNKAVNKYAFLREHKTLFSNNLINMNKMNEYGYSYTLNTGNSLRVVNNSKNGTLLIANNQLTPPYTITLKCTYINTLNKEMYVLTGLHSGDITTLNISTGSLYPVNTQARGLYMTSNSEVINLATANWLGFNNVPDTNIGPLSDYRIVYQNNSNTSRFIQYSVNSNIYSIMNVNSSRVWSIANPSSVNEYLFVLIKQGDVSGDVINQEAVFELSDNLIN